MMFAVLRLALVLAAGFGIIVYEPALEAIQRPSPTELEIHILSSRPELITGGDALLKISLPSGADPGTTRVPSTGATSQQSFASTHRGRWSASLKGCRLGEIRFGPSRAGRAPNCW